MVYELAWDVEYIGMLTQAINLLACMEKVLSSIVVELRVVKRSVTACLLPPVPKEWLGPSVLGHGLAINKPGLPQEESSIVASCNN